VNQFVNNTYQKPLYETEKLESNITYDLQFLIPAITHEIEEAIFLQKKDPTDPALKASLATVGQALQSIRLTKPYPNPEQLNMDGFSEGTAKELITWLENYRSALRKHRDRLTREKDLLIDSLKKEAGGLEDFIHLKRSHYNEQLAQLVLNRNNLYKLVKKDGRLLRKMDPVYAYPSKRNGRAHFYASVKQWRDTYMPTPYFNLIAIWAMTLILFVLLRYSLLKKLLDLSGRKTVRWLSGKNIQANYN